MHASSWQETELLIFKPSGKLTNQWALNGHIKMIMCEQ
jgi:hypothetical protein